MRSLLPIICVFNVFPTNCLFNNGTPEMPTANRMMAVAGINDAIFLLGGFPQGNILSFNQSVWIDTNISITEVYGTGQFYTQINDELFMIYGNSMKVFAPNDIVNYFIPDWNSQTLNVGHKACLASNDQYLFVVGGELDNGSIYIISDTVQIFDLNNDEWIDNSMNNISAMTTPREALTCNTHPLNDQLYAIGGRNSSGVLNTIEVIGVSDLLNGSLWDGNHTPLFGATAGSRSVVYQNYILVVGGFDNVQNLHIHVDIINVLDGSVMQTGNNALSYGIEYPAVIISQHVLYVLGGWDGDHAMKTWQYIEMSDLMSEFTESPTTLTDTPTPAQTVTTFDKSTEYPTFDLTSNPSNTTGFTLKPSPHPTANPLFPTTLSPTTIYPTETSTSVPTSFESTEFADEQLEQKEESNVFVIIISVFGTVILILIAIFAYKLRKKHILSQEIDELYAADPGSVGSSVKNTTGAVVKCVSMSSDTEINDSNEQKMQEYKSSVNQSEVNYVEIKQWLTDTVKLPQYYETFIVNGFTSMDFIKSISDKSDLEDIGITLKAHQLLIVKEVNKLNDVNSAHQTEPSGSVQQEGGTRTGEGTPEEEDQRHQYQTPNYGYNNTHVQQECEPKLQNDEFVIIDDQPTKK